MAQRRVRAISERVLGRVDVGRREFLKAVVVGTTFVTPVMTSLSLRSPRPIPRPAYAQAPPGSALEVPAQADAFLRAQAPNVNEGANPLLFIESSPTARIVVAFDPNVVENSAGSAVSVALVLDLVDIAIGAGQTASVNAHAMFETFPEGNGRDLGTTAPVPGTGTGVTWNTPEDLDISNTTLETVQSPWFGGRFQSTPTAEVPHANTLSGSVQWDVTADARLGIAAWLLKLGNETTPAVSIAYRSIQGGPAPDGSLRSPRLIFRYGSGS